LLVFSRFFPQQIPLFVILNCKLFPMSQQINHFSLDLYKSLELDILKFKQFGPPVFRLNIPCKHKEQCKYGKFSCNYSHECFCKFQKNGRKCQNAFCTHSHALPLEFLFAQALFLPKSQFSSNTNSVESPKPASEPHFFSMSSSVNDTANLYEFRFKPHEFPTKCHEKSPVVNAINSSQPPKQAETHFTAFSSLFQQPANSRKPSMDHSKQLFRSNSSQISSKMDKESVPIDNGILQNAQQSTKNSTPSKKAADPISTVPAQISPSKHSPPPVKHTQKSRFNSQIKQTTSGNLTLATATPAIHSFSPVFNSKNQNSLDKLTTEVNFAGSPAAPASQILSDVVKYANVRAYKISARGDIGDAPERISHPAQSLTDTSFSARSAYTPVHYCPASPNPILDTLGTLSSVEVEDTDAKNRKKFRNHQIWGASPASRSLKTTPFLLRIALLR